MVAFRTLILILECDSGARARFRVWWDHNDPLKAMRLCCSARTMCPIWVHWHVEANYREYWKVKITVASFNYGMNYTQWTLVAWHPNFNNITRVYRFDYKPLDAFGSLSEYMAFIVKNAVIFCDWILAFSACWSSTNWPNCCDRWTWSNHIRSTIK